LKGEGNFLPASIESPPPARLGQNAETKFSSSLIEKEKWARAKEKAEENFVEA